MKNNSILTLLLFLFIFSCKMIAQDMRDKADYYPELKPIPKSELDKILSIPEIEVPVQRGRYPEMPAVVDNSVKPYMRPLIAQVGLECGQASSIGNGFTYEIDCARDLPANVPQNQYPTHFAYNFLNGGSDAGVSFFETWEILKHCGTPNVEDYGGMAYGGASRWISGYENYYHGMQNRITEVRSIRAGTPEGIALLKGWIWDHLDGSPHGGLANFYSQFTSGFGVFPPGTPEEGKHVITEWGPYPNHAMTIVGYNDSIRWDYNNDGQYTNHIDINGDGEVNVKDWEIGGFKLANTYGSIGGWGDQGYAYMMYKTLGDDAESGGIWEHLACVVKVKPEYSPKVTMKITLQHTSRKKLKITAGISADTSAAEPDFVLDFPIFDFQGGDLYMQGGTSDSDRTIEFGLDLNPLLSYINSGQRVKYFLQVHENDPADSDQGEIIGFSVINYEDEANETQYQIPNTPITNNSITTLGLNKTCEFIKPAISTSSLPPATLYEPYSFQLGATGGTPPYHWGIRQEYEEITGSGSFPMVIDNQLILDDNNKGQAEFPLPFSFPFYGNFYDTVYLHADGYLMFNGDRFPWPYLISEKTMFINTRSISPYACHPMIIDPGSGGGIWSESNDSSTTFRWKCRIFDTPSTSLNFAVSIFASGKIEIFYGEMINNGWVSRLAGISDGDGFNHYFTETAGYFIPEENTKITLLPVQLPMGLTLSEDGIYSGITEQVHQDTPVTFTVTDNNNIRSFATLPFSTEGMAISCSIVSGSDQFIEFGETAYLDVTVQNLTGSVCNGSLLTLTMENPYITLTDNMESTGPLEPGETQSFGQAFSFEVSNTVPDRFPVVFTITLENTNQEWSRSFTTKAYAPVMEIASVIIADLEDGLLYPGETADIKAILRNRGGALAEGISVNLSSYDPYLVINASYSTIDFLLPGSTDTLLFNVTATEDASTGYAALATANIQAQNGFSVSIPMVIVIGLIVENFETGDFSMYEWNFSGDAAWTTSKIGVWEGEYSARSGTIEDSQNSAMELDYIAIHDDSISFYRKVSSEINYDFLVFSVDNNELGNWSGEEAWARESYPVSKGAHIFSWDYIKDYSLSNGSDCGWVDFILLPAYSDAVGISNIQAEQPSMVLFPNPASGKILVNYTIDNETEINICIYSSTGVPVISSGILNAETGTNQVEIDLEGFAAGTYYCILSSGYWKVIRPLILLTGR